MKYKQNTNQHQASQQYNRRERHDVNARNRMNEGAKFITTIDNSAVLLYINIIIFFTILQLHSQATLLYSRVLNAQKRDEYQLPSTH